MRYTYKNTQTTFIKNSSFRITRFFTIVWTFSWLKITLSLNTIDVVLSKLFICNKQEKKTWISISFHQITWTFKTRSFCNIFVNRQMLYFFHGLLQLFKKFLPRCILDAFSITTPEWLESYWLPPFNIISIHKILCNFFSLKN